jgi:hypothetical protein
MQYQVTIEGHFEITDYTVHEQHESEISAKPATFTQKY